MLLLRLFLFGVPRCERDGETISIQRRKTLALLAYLAVTGQPHSRDALATLLWPEHDPSSALANLRRDLSRLKDAVGEQILIIDRIKVGFNPKAVVWLDVAEFQSRMAVAQKHDHRVPEGAPVERCEECQAALTEAASLYTGDFMTGFGLSDSPAFDEWQFFQAESLRQLLAECLKKLIAWHSTVEEYERGIEYARRWLALDPLHEPAHRQLMQLYSRSGQQSAAIRQYQECVRILQEELGVEPEKETIELYEAIKARQLTPRVVDGRQAATPPVVEKLSPGERYILEERIASGGHGDVYRGRDQVTGQPVAIKRLKSELITQDPSYLERFIREGESLRELKHPNIVAFLDMVVEDGQRSLVMEYVPGGTLRDLLERQPKLPVEQVVDIALELADALSRAHHLNLIHRDIKPDNVLLGEDGAPRLMDFGLARLLKEDAHLTQAGALMGSPAYMSPEAVRGEELDARSDIWSFGVVLFEMLSGRLPFEGEQLTPILYGILQEPAPEIESLRPDVPPVLAELVRGMLVKEREARIGSMRQVAASLEAIRSGQASEGLDLQSGLMVQAGQLLPANSPSRALILPARSTPFIGREAELAALSELLARDEVRLVTILGLGGMGKTSLALAAAQHMYQKLDDRFTNGVVFVSLSGVESIDGIPAALAKTLRLPLSGQTDPGEAINNYLSDKEMLLVLDNFEQLLEGVEVLNQWLFASPGVKLLVTSREPLQVQAEWRFYLEGLSHPQERQWPGNGAPPHPHPESYEAVQLFVQSAQQARSDFQLSAETLPYVMRLCQLVSGVPLAIKLAAAWLRIMPPERIVEEVARNMDILSGSLRDMPSRQRSMHAIYQHTWDLLLPEEQQVFQALSVFRGGFQEGAALEVVTASLFLLAGLVDRGLVQYHDNSRYEMHEMTRQFAAEKLKAAGLEDALARRHSEYYLLLLSNHEAALHGESPAEVVGDLKGDIDNIRQAWQWAVAHAEVGLVAPAVEALATFYELAGLLSEGERVFRTAALQMEEKVLEGEGTSLVCHLYIKQALFFLNLGHLGDIWELVEKAAQLAQVGGDEKRIADIFFIRGFGYRFVGDLDLAMQQLEQAVASYQNQGRKQSLVAALNILGDIQARKQLPEKALASHQQALQVASELKDKHSQALTLSFIGHAYYFREDYRQALAYFESAVMLFEQLEDLLAIARTAGNIGYIQNRLGDYAQAWKYTNQAIQSYRQIGGHPENNYDVVGDLYFVQGDYDQARRFYSEALQYVRKSGQRLEEAACLIRLSNLDMAMGLYDSAETQLRQALDIAQEAGHSKRIAVARGELGRLYRLKGRTGEAMALLDQAIAELRRIAGRYYLGYFLIEKAELLFDRGEIPLAQELVEEGARMAEEIGRKPVVVQARLLAAKLSQAAGLSEMR